MSSPSPTEHRPSALPEPKVSPLRGGLILSSLVMLAVLTLTGAAAWHINARNAESDAKHFEAITNRLHDEILRRVKTYRYGLKGTRSVFASDKHVTRRAFRNIVAARELDTEFPAATGVGYIDRVNVADIDGYTAQVRADASPEFTVRTRAGATGHDDLLVIRYAEPMERKHDVVGIDLGQNPQRRAAAEHAMKTGDLAITGQVATMQNQSDGARFLMLMPHFSPGSPLDTPAQREAAHEGWVFMAMNASPLFAGIKGMVRDQVDFDVCDMANPQNPQVLYGDPLAQTTKSHGKTVPFEAHTPGHRDIFKLEVGGRAWQVTTRSTPHFHAASNAGVWMTLGAGVAMAALLGLLLNAQSTLLRRAQKIAHEMTADLHRVALTDRLTKLPNRAAVIPMIQDAIDRARKTPDQHYCVLFIDLDRFKAVNDTLGHGAGDELLAAVADRLHSGITAARNAGGLGPQSVAARLGGDEFLVLLDGLPHPEAGTKLAERLLGEINEPCVISGRNVCVGASIGVVHHAAGYFSAEEIVRDADTAMYEAKGRDSGSCQVFDVSMRTRITDRLRIENDLRGGIDRGEFFLNYQPIVSLNTGEVTTVEALVRWRHPELGVLSPDIFIGVAEETGMILPLGAWVLDEALAQLSRWNRYGTAFAPGVSVNLSRKQLTLPELPLQVLEALARHGTDPGQLHLEVTESQIMENPDTAIASLRRLREAGVRIAIDDFGTGHSSLACLHAFPTDVLKIDRAFVANLERDANLVALLRSVTEMARTLGKQVVAEGIETDAQHQLLHELACDMGQGYLFSRPLAPEHVLDFCRQRERRSAA